ncbi:hypothetical protein ACQ4PT_070875 [Festuca glaucescens]
MVLMKADERPPSSSAIAAVEEKRNLQESQAEVAAPECLPPVSSKAEKFSARPGFGTVGKREEEYRVAIKHASNLDLYNLQQFLAGRHRELPQDIIQALDIALRECPTTKFDQDGTRVSVVDYFRKQYNYSLRYTNLPCLQAGSDSRPTYLPMEIVNRNNYGNDSFSKEFGMKVTNQLALVDARVLPAPSSNITTLDEIKYAIL